MYCFFLQANLQNLPLICSLRMHGNKKTAEKASLSKSLSTVSFPLTEFFIMLLFSESSPEIPAARLLCRKSHARFRPRRRSSFLPPPDTSCRCPGTDPLLIKCDILPSHRDAHDRKAHPPAKSSLLQIRLLFPKGGRLQEFFCCVFVCHNFFLASFCISIHLIHLITCRDVRILAVSPF